MEELRELERKDVREALESLEGVTELARRKHMAGVAARAADEISYDVTKLYRADDYTGVHYNTDSSRVLLLKK